MALYKFCIVLYCVLVVCSATWRRRDNIHSFGGAPVTAARCGSESGCKLCCVVDPHCTAVDVDMRLHPARCYMYSWPDAVRFRVPMHGVNQFELVSRANCIAGISASFSLLTHSSINQSITHTHTHTQPFNGRLSGTTRVSRYQKGKTSLDFTEVRDSEWQWHQLGHMQVCTSLHTNNHANAPPLRFLQAGCSVKH